MPEIQNNYGSNKHSNNEDAPKTKTQIITKFNVI
jgi:hypothetical protein